MKKFLDWFEAQPLYKTFWLIPFVMVLWLIATIKNYVTGEK